MKSEDDIVVNGVLNLNPGKEFDENNRFWQGCPTIARTRGGRLYAGWYAGGTREPSLYNYNVLVKSDDNGRTWSRPVLVIPSLKDDIICCIDCVINNIFSAVNHVINYSLCACTKGKHCRKCESGNNT